MLSKREDRNAHPFSSNLVWSLTSLKTDTAKLLTGKLHYTFKYMELSFINLLL